VPPKIGTVGLNKTRPAGYRIVKQVFIVALLTGSLTAASISSIFLLFDTGFTSLSRFILLDQPLLLSIAASFYSCMLFRKEALDSSFNSGWKLKLFILGFCLGCAISIKFVGAFIVLYVGILTIFDLWILIGDLKTDFLLFSRHFLYRALFLILLPVGIYIGCYVIHFNILYKSGAGDAYHSSLFQSSLKNNYYSDKRTSYFVRDHAEVTIRTVFGHPNRYLHSHWDLFPVGAGAWHQMVGTYVHHDENNKWIIRKWKSDTGNKTAESDVILRHGDFITLTHKVTGRNLHSHAVPALQDKMLYQVTGYGDHGVGDENDVWILEIVGGKIGDLLTSMTTFSLKHMHLQCLLTDRGENLPKEWGYMMSEIGCSPWIRKTNENKGLYDFEWEIVENESNDDASILIRNFGTNFWFKFMELQKRMFFVMKRIGTSGDGQESHAAWKWPLNLNTQKFCPNSPRASMVGNPLIYAFNLLCLILFMILETYDRFKNHRHDEENETSTNVSAAAHLFAAYLIHYVPFFFFGRQLYIHHYYPAFYFSCLLSGVILDRLLKLTARITQRFKGLLTSVIVINVFCGALYSFVYFSPVVYGMTGGDENFAKLSNSSYHYLHLVNSWDL